MEMVESDAQTKYASSNGSFKWKDDLFTKDLPLQKYMQIPTANAPLE